MTTMRAVLHLVLGIAGALGLAWPGVVFAQLDCCPGDTEGSPGGTVCVPILIDNPQGIDAFGLDFTYNTGSLTFVQGLRSQLTASWTLFDAQENNPGTVRLGGFGDAIQSATPDTLGYFCMSINDPADTVTYEFANFVDDLAGAPNCQGLFRSSTDPVEAVTWGRVKRHYHR